MRGGLSSSRLAGGRPPKTLCFWSPRLSSSMPRKAAGTTTAGGLSSIAIGTVAGTLGSLVGMGGGFVSIPCLTSWMRLTQHQAHGTSLGAVFATGAAGSTAYAMSGHVDYEAAAAMAVAGVASAHLGARSISGMSPPTLKLALGILMIAAAPLLPLRDHLLDSSSEEISSGPSPPEEISRDRSSEEAEISRDRSSSVFGFPDGRSGKALKMCAIGVGSGFLAGVFGVGGGVITVPAISLATSLDHKEVLGTSLAAMVLPAFTGSVTHFRQGNLIPKIAFPLALGTAAGAFVGGKYAARHLDESSLKWGFSCLMLVLGARTVVVARAVSPAASFFARKTPKCR